MFNCVFDLTINLLIVMIAIAIILFVGVIICVFFAKFIDWINDKYC